MEALLPTNYLQFTGGIFFLFAIIFLFISLYKKLSIHSMKAFAMLSIIGVSLIANHLAIYFLVVFVIATAVTELDFLKDVAAIVRGSKNYFGSKKVSGVSGDGVSIKRSSKKTT
jgi:hypothetical protein